MLIDVDQSESEFMAEVDFGSNCPSDVIFCFTSYLAGHISI